MNQDALHPYRSHTCGELRRAQIAQQARLSGWVFRKRDHGHLLFIDLRDHYGVTQVVIQPDRDFFDFCTRLKLESVITVTGQVVARAPETVNPSLGTGEVELVAVSVALDAACDPLPL